MEENETDMEWLIDKLLQLLGLGIKKAHKVFLWRPESPVRNNNKCSLIDNYPKTFAMVDGDISSTMISGAEAFTQAVQFFILTERRKYPIYSEEYGIEEASTIFTEKSVEEFQRQAQNVAIHLIDYFGEWIEEIYQINRKKDILVIDMKVAGRAKTLKVEIKKISAK